MAPPAPRTFTLQLLPAGHQGAEAEPGGSRERSCLSEMCQEVGRPPPHPGGSRVGWRQLQAHRNRSQGWTRAPPGVGGSTSCRSRGARPGWLVLATAAAWLCVGGGPQAHPTPVPAPRPRAHHCVLAVQRQAPVPSLAWPALPCRVSPAQQPAVSPRAGRAPEGQRPLLASSQHAGCRGCDPVVSAGSPQCVLLRQAGAPRPRVALQELLVRALEGWGHRPCSERPQPWPLCPLAGWRWSECQGPGCCPQGARGQQQRGGQQWARGPCGRRGGRGAGADLEGVLSAALAVLSRLGVGPGLSARCLRVRMRVSADQPVPRRGLRVPGGGLQLTIQHLPVLLAAEEVSSTWGRRDCERWHRGTQG